MVATPRLDEVIEYLQAQGWTPQTQWRNGQVWSHGEFDVLVPDGEVVDYGARMRALVRCVADSEQRSTEIVVRDIVSGGVDIVGYRAGDAATEVSVEAGTAALTALRSLLVICADQVAGSEIRIATMREHAVAELLNSTILLPRRDVFGFDLVLAGPGSRLSRRAAVRLLDVAATMREATDGRGFGMGAEMWSDTVEMFSALGSAERDPMRFELSFHWSRQVPRPGVVIEFSSTEIARLPRLLDVGTIASSPLPTESVPGAEQPAVIEGVVVGVDNDGGPKATVRGVLFVDATSTGRQRRVTVRLRTPEEYVKALVAHRSRSRVRATGIFDGRRDLQISENGFTVIDGDGS
ncbi:hypothetical protein ACWZHB_25700 [Nocardia sp. FBN12]|uniref:hypothetical protein n=1 Tax=Nocardia sp. FBN12 TaxID=3419766 RepID=UPI003D044567